MISRFYLLAQTLAVIGLTCRVAVAGDEGRIVGQLELVPGAPCAECLIYVEGAPAQGKCDGGGFFDIDHIPEGRRILRILKATKAGSSTILRWVSVGVTKDHITNLGTIVLWKCGVVSGRIIGAEPERLAGMVVSVDGLCIATKPGSYAYYLLTGVAMGDRKIVLQPIWYEQAPSSRTRMAAVSPGKVTLGVDFILNPPIIKEMEKRPPDAHQYLRPEMPPITRPVDENGSPTKPMEKPEQLDQSKKAWCDQYTRSAISQNRENIRNCCGFTGA